jgi:hypothetical protein
VVDALSDFWAETADEGVGTCFVFICDGFSR